MNAPSIRRLSITALLCSMLGACAVEPYGSPGYYPRTTVIESYPGYYRTYPNYPTVYYNTTIYRPAPPPEAPRWRSPPPREHDAGRDQEHGAGRPNPPTMPPPRAERPSPPGGGDRADEHHRRRD